MRLILLTDKPRKSSLLVSLIVQQDNSEIYRVTGWFSNKFNDILNLVLNKITNNFEICQFINTVPICTIITKENIHFNVGLVPSDSQECADLLGNDSGLIVDSVDNINLLSDLI